MAGRSIKITEAMKQDAIKLVKLMGCAVVEAPCEAEAQCAELVKMGLAFGTGTEDMDALTFGTNYLMRGFNGKKEPICQIELKQVLAGFEMNMEEFIDLCILCGCDYTNTIQGMGPKTAFNLMKECGSIEKVLEKIEAANAANEEGGKKKKYHIPSSFLYEQSRKLFLSPDVQSDPEFLKKCIVFDKPKEEEMKEWLQGSKGFAETKVTNGLERLNKS